MSPATRGREVSEDSLLDGAVRLRQPVNGYRVAIDPVLLAAAVPARPGERILDAGTGTGAAAMCLAHRVPGTTILGIEVQPALAALARDNAAVNGFATRLEVIEGDVASPRRPASPAFDHVMANPPFRQAGRATRPAAAERAMAHHEAGATLRDWSRYCFSRVRGRGTVTFIYAASRLAELLVEMAAAAPAIDVLPLWPRQGRPAKRVIVQARPGVAGELRLLPGLVLHQADGAYTAGAQALLRRGSALELASFAA